MVETAFDTARRPRLSNRSILTVLAADVVSYVRLTEAAEEETHSRLRSLRVRIIDPCVVSYRGRIIKNTGDGFLASFDSTLDAVRCAIELQREVGLNESTQTADRRIVLRMGLNVGDVIVEDDDIYGTDVNIAVRLEQCAPPGGIVVSDSALTLIRTVLSIASDDLGRLRLKNISQLIHAHLLLVPKIDRSAVTLRRRLSKPTRIPSIAVLPFQSIGKAKLDDNYFGQGVVDEIIVALSGIRGLLVISRTSTLSYAGDPIDLKKVGMELGVRYILTGRVQRSSVQLRITAELTDVESGLIIWSDKYYGKPSELFELQDKIATRIVWSIAPHVREAEINRARRKRPESLDAHELVMQSIDLLYRMNFPDFERARKLLQRAIELDDGYATAYAYASLWHIHVVAQGWSHDLRSDSLEAGRLAASAVDRDPTDAFALALHAHVNSFLFRNYNAAIGAFDRALAASPSHAMAWSLSSGVYSYMGEGRLAVERAEKGLRLSPVDTQSFFYLLLLGMAHYANGTFEEAVVWTRKSMGLNPHLCANLRVLTASLVALGQFDQAREIGAKLMEFQPRFRVSEYAELCPFRADLREEFLERLKEAGLE
jgi:adenylate cyclase